jgi:hypothetical protein
MMNTGGYDDMDVDPEVRIHSRNVTRIVWQQTAQRS